MSEDRRTDKSLEVITDALRAGSSLRGAAAQVGRSESWLRQWRLDNPEVAKAVELALANWESSTVKKINSNVDWKAQAWLLARRFPDDYGDRQRLDVHNYDPKKAKAEAQRLLGLEPGADDE